MNQDEFKRLWDEAGEGDEIEVRLTASEARVNPETARTLLHALTRAAQSDASYVQIYQVLAGIILNDAADRIAIDDAFTLRIVNKFIDAVEKSAAQPPQPTPRGKVRTTTSA